MAKRKRLPEIDIWPATFAYFQYRAKSLREFEEGVSTWESYADLHEHLEEGYKKLMGLHLYSMQFSMVNAQMDEDDKNKTLGWFLLGFIVLCVAAAIFGG